MLMLWGNNGLHRAGHTGPCQTLPLTYPERWTTMLVCGKVIDTGTGNHYIGFRRVPITLAHKAPAACVNLSAKITPAGALCVCDTTSRLLPYIALPWRRGNQAKHRAKGIPGSIAKAARSKNYVLSGDCDSEQVADRRTLAEMLEVGVLKWVCRVWCYTMGYVEIHLRRWG